MAALLRSDNRVLHAARRAVTLGVIARYGLQDSAGLAGVPMDLPRTRCLTVVRHVPWVATFLALQRFLFEQREKQVAVLVRPQWIGLGVGQSSIGVVDVSGDGLPAKEP